ncbi:MAG: hypothetical protein JRE40_00920 [Deltaproteobacteria bacterium]|nr:hypothetical protein [Deltaproteobacteria bacterium]
MVHRRIESVVFQTRFGGVKAALEDQGNCFQACVATILRIPLDSAFDCVPFAPGDWFPAFNEWLRRYNLGCIYITATDAGRVPCTALVGTHIAEWLSTGCSDGTLHAVVMRDGQVVHDPNPYTKGQGKFEGMYLFVPIDPSQLIHPTDTYTARAKTTG